MFPHTLSTNLMLDLSTVRGRIVSNTKLYYLILYR